MSPRALLLTGVGTLVFGLFLVLAVDVNPMSASPHTALVRGYLSNIAALTGSGLVVAAALLRGLRPPREDAPPPAIDHYS